MEATIIRLGPDSQISNVVSYEEAFGEFSEFRGRGRARRQKRAKDRIMKRRERRKWRQEGRAEQQEARQTRKDTRKRRRVARKAMGDDPEQQEEGNSVSESGSGNTDSVNQNDSSNQDQSQSQEQSGGQTQEQGGTEEWGGSQTSMQDEGSEENQGSDDSQSEESNDSGEDSGFDGQGENPYSLDGDYTTPFTVEDFENFDGEELTNNFSDAEGRERTINPQVQKIVVLIEREKAYIKKLRGLIKVTKNTEKKRKYIDAVHKHVAHLKDLEDKLHGYENAEGRKHSIRKHEVRGAKRNLHAYIKRKRSLKKQNGGAETPVEAGLNAEMSEQRIEVPAGEKSNATGLNGLDNQDDFDAPPTRTVELSSNAEGDKPKMKINWTYVAVGAVIAVAGIWAYNKYVRKK